MRSLHVLRQNRAYLWAAAGLFVLGAVLGLLFTKQIAEESYVAASLKHLQDIAQQTQAQDNAAYTSLVIFLNNLRAALIMLVVGVPFAVCTAAALLVNGMMVGVVFAGVGTGLAAHVPVWQLVLFGLLPHGIFELPAIFIASAFGIKLGRMLLVPLRARTRWQSLVHVAREVWSISWIVLVLLVVAAGVEGTVTPKLIHTFIAK